MRKRFHGLKRLKLRQSWNKYNLYNLARAEPPRFDNRTFFQQKWTAKSLTRAYHGETVREKKWHKLFRRTMKSVINMDPKNLAEHDGSEQAEGRGSGLDVPPNQKPKSLPRIPYLNMTYAPTERRLDTAVFRALFASSTRQARQFVIHGCVRVNGEKMIYPGYQLNPGDMFQVEPDRVLFATGARKDRVERAAGRKLRAAKASQKAATHESESESEPSEPPTPKSDPPPEVAVPEKDIKKALQSLISQAKAILSSPSSALTAQRKQDLRAFQRTVKRNLSRPDGLTTTSLDSQLAEITAKMAPKPSAPTTNNPLDLPTLSSPELQAEAATLSPDQLRVLRAALEGARENPIDASKPYATPWRPRDWMSAFAFIPRYLEVHHKICSAVYIRHPVARPGLAEVPTPYNLELNSLAHNWYLRRR